MFVTFYKFYATVTRFLYDSFEIFYKILTDEKLIENTVVGKQYLN